MAVPEDSEDGGCYIWIIYFLLFIFTVSGAIFLVLYMVQPTSYSSTTTFWYPVIGVSLVCFPWFFWLLTLLYRIISRACGFRMSCFSSGADHPDDDDDGVPSGVPVSSNNEGGVSAIHDANIGTSNGIIDGGDDGNGDLESASGDKNGNRASGVRAQPGSPRRVHFGGVVVLGEDDREDLRNQESPKSLSSLSSSSSSRDESEMPLKLCMAS